MWLTLPTAVTAQGNATDFQILFIVPDVFTNFSYFTDCMLPKEKRSKIIVLPCYLLKFLLDTLHNTAHLCVFVCTCRTTEQLNVHLLFTALTK